jgi:hypothetical protein
MPLPKPKGNESKADFISRAHSELASEYKDPKQRHAIILHQWVKKDIFSELMAGAQEEMEHTDDPLVAVKIALDHLKELPDYYTRLKAAGLSA